MRMGTLPIVAPTGGLRDIVEDDVNGTPGAAKTQAVSG
jgi:glycogen synthase